MAEPAPARTVVASRPDAERLIDALVATVADLSALLDREADAVAAGRIAAGLSGEAGKAAVLATYLCGLEAAKANAVALARFASDRLPALRDAQVRLHASAERNGTVLATAKAVSESLLRGLSDELARAARPLVYESGGRIPSIPKARGPIAVSKTY